MEVKIYMIFHFKPIILMPLEGAHLLVKIQQIWLLDLKNNKILIEDQILMLDSNKVVVLNIPLNKKRITKKIGKSKKYKHQAGIDHIEKDNSIKLVLQIYLPRIDKNNSKDHHSQINLVVTNVLYNSVSIQPRQIARK